MLNHLQGDNGEEKFNYTQADRISIKERVFSLYQLADDLLNRSPFQIDRCFWAAETGRAPRTICTDIRKITYYISKTNATDLICMCRLYLFTGKGKNKQQTHGQKPSKFCSRGYLLTKLCFLYPTTVTYMRNHQPWWLTANKATSLILHQHTRIGKQVQPRMIATHLDDLRVRLSAERTHILVTYHLTNSEHSVKFMFSKQLREREILCIQTLFGYAVLVVLPCMSSCHDHIQK